MRNQSNLLPVGSLRSPAWPAGWSLPGASLLLAFDEERVPAAALELDESGISRPYLWKCLPAHKPRYFPCLLLLLRLVPFLAVLVFPSHLFYSFPFPCHAQSPFLSAFNTLTARSNHLYVAAVLDLTPRFKAL